MSAYSYVTPTNPDCSIWAGLRNITKCGWLFQWVGFFIVARWLVIGWGRLGGWPAKF